MVKEPPFSGVTEVLCSAFNIGRKSNLIVFVLVMLLPVTTVFIFMLLGGKIYMC
ncbi:hypothetical protein UJ18_004161 [Salmonella enterica subsp. enterica serovar Pomona]|nr:hypothetical protein [Salmonella enterica subsp. enterica serovar Pomona]